MENTLSGELEWKYKDNLLVAQKNGLTIRLSSEPDQCCLTFWKDEKEIQRIVTVAQRHGLFSDFYRLGILAKNTVFEKEILRQILK